VRDRLGEDRLVRSNAGFVRLLYAGERALESGDVQRAAEIYWCALLAHPSPLAAEPFVRFARMAKMHGPLRAYAEQEVSLAEASGDVTELAIALEVLADACDDPLGDLVTRASLDRLRDLDKDRADHAVRLEQAHALAGDAAQIVAVRGDMLDTASSAELIDTAVLALGSGTPLRDVADWIERAAAEPACSLLALRLADATCAPDAVDDLVGLSRRIADRIGQPTSGAVFLSRAATVLAERDQAAAAPIIMDAFDLHPKYPILETARRIALGAGSWADLLRVAQVEATFVAGAEAARHHHLAAVVAMDKLGDYDVALTELRATVALDPLTIDALLRLRVVADGEDPAILDEVYRSALADEPAVAIKVELHRIAAEHAHAAGDLERAASEYRTVLTLAPSEPRAVAALHDLESEVRKEGIAAAIEARLPVERDAFVVASLHRRLAALVAPHDPKAAMQALRRALGYKRDDERALRQLIDVALAAGDADAVASACDSLAAVPLPRKRRVPVLLRAAEIYLAGTNADAADDAIESALDASTNLADTLKQVLKLYRSDQPQRIGPHLERVMSLARKRLQQDVRDADAARALALSSATLAAGPAASPLRRTAAFARELLEALGESATDLPPARELVVDPHAIADAALERALLAGTSEGLLLDILRDASDALTKRSDADLTRYGITRRDALRKNHASVRLVREVAQPLGYDDVIVYVSRRYAHAMIIEPTQPVSLVLGHEIARGSAADIRFAAGASFKLAKLGLAIPARMSLAELTLTIGALVHLRQTTLGIAELDPEIVVRESAAFGDADPALRERLHARTDVSDDGLTAAHIVELARDLKVIGIEAGLVASGSLARTLAILSGAIRTDVAGILADPVTRRVISFALTDVPL
jgi:tetratricopeptide (TPR) repeat protein